MFRILLKESESKRSLYRQYSPTSVANAMQKIRSKEMSVYNAAKVYSVPETALRDWVAGRISEETIKSGPSTLLSIDEEAALVKHLSYMASLRYGYTRAEVLEIASEYTV
ncbi:hypothetical protein KUTeg_005999 [Tegillarca granosa]|uniref:HTH psq-type domain-containing protein n=1 Tax=Tegillarca granosa TaxID=220873 RepID=A0ABQ9FI68_TEGGR|nr:hypothetical protein KUTeg_005999 [Tegillarca granosa]